MLWSAGASKSCAGNVGRPVSGSIRNRSASFPPRVQDNLPNGWPPTAGITQTSFSGIVESVIPLRSRVGWSSSRMVTEEALPIWKLAGVMEVIRTSKSSSGSSTVSCVVVTTRVALVVPARSVNDPLETAVKSEGEVASPDTVFQVTVASRSIWWESSSVTLA